MARKTCSRCNRGVAGSGFQMCAVHRREGREAVKKSRRRQMKLGLCIDGRCPHKAVKGGQRCVGHLLKIRLHCRRLNGYGVWQPGMGGRKPLAAVGV